jgi:hypothetical protein
LAGHFPTDFRHHQPDGTRRAKIMGVVSAGDPASPFVDLIGPVNEGKKPGIQGQKSGQ